MRAIACAACVDLLLPRLLSCRRSHERPNVVVILIDDMGFSDLGCYGSEIPTPNIDKLAADGVRFTQFYNTARCSPSRAALLTGLYPHQAGMGFLDNMVVPNSKGTQGRLRDDCVTMAEVLGDAGYFTIMTGKWHLGQHARHAAVETRLHAQPERRRSANSTFPTSSNAARTASASTANATSSTIRSSARTGTAPISSPSGA